MTSSFCQPSEQGSKSSAASSRFPHGAIGRDAE